MEFPIFSGADVCRVLDTAGCIALMTQTLKDEAAGQCIQYLRTAIDLPNGNVLGLMPAWFGDCFGVKSISVYHTNGGTGYPSHQGQIQLFGAQYGNLLAAVDASAVTKIRTGAVSAAASLALANPDSKVLAVLGCGAQGESHVEALRTAFDLTEVRLWDLNMAAAEALAARTPIKAAAFATAEEAVVGADIICTVTPSKTPVLQRAWIKPGAHINAVGACAPNARELPSDLVAEARFFCDNVDSVLHESGDYLFPAEEGLIDSSHICGTVGQVLLGTVPGRQTHDEITIFEALGMAVEDIACAKYLYDRREELA